MNIDLDLYRVFVSVATNGSFSKAAEELCVTQSAVSQSIGNLEKIYEEKLFERERSGVKITKFGSELYKEVAPYIKNIDNAFIFMKNNKKRDELIKIGASDTITSNILLKVIKGDFAKNHFYIESLLSDKEKILAVENGSLDCAIINDYNLPLANNLYKKQLLTLNYGFFYNPSFLQVDESNVFEQTFLVKNAGTKARVEFNKKFYEFSFKFNNLMEFSHDNTILNATKLGLGVGFLPKEYVTEELKQINLSGQTLTKNVVIIYKNLSQLIEKLISEISKIK